MTDEPNGHHRPLATLSAAETRLEIEQLRGALWMEITRIDGLMEGRKTALELQATEYERRLADLNHEAVRIKTAQSESVSVDKFNGFQERIDERLKKIENFNSKMIAYGSVLLLLWGLALKFVRIP